MRAIVVRQPWASLIAHGIKTIETRPFRPTNTIKPGEQFAIVAGKALPAAGTKGDKVGGWQVVRPRSARWMGGAPNAAWLEADTGQLRPCHLGSVVAVVTFDAALRMIPCEPYVGPISNRREDREAVVEWRGRWSPPHTYIGIGGVDGGPWFVEGSGDNADASPLFDELPLGDYAPGRFGWLLSAPHRLRTPVPVKGKQGVFTLPDDVTAAVNAQIGVSR